MENCARARQFVGQELERVFPLRVNLVHYSALDCLFAVQSKSGFRSEISAPVLVDYHIIDEWVRQFPFEVSFAISPRRYG